MTPTTCSELEELKSKSSNYLERLQQSRANVASLEEYIKDNYEDLGEHAQPIAEIFNIELTKTLEVQVKVSYSVTVTVPLNWDEDNISDNLRIPEGFESDDNDMVIESESSDMDRITVYE